MSLFNKIDVYTANKIYSYVYNECLNELLIKTRLIKNLLNALPSSCFFGYGYCRILRPNINMYNTLLLKYYMMSTNDINEELNNYHQNKISLLSCIRCDILKQSYRDLFNICLL
jgi:hypothetical protein